MSHMRHALGIIAAALLGVAPAHAACPTFPVAPGAIAARWAGLGGCGSSLGDPLGPQRRNPYTGGVEQDFAHGQIVLYDRWTSGVEGDMPQFVLSASVAGDIVHVDWGDTKPFSYDFFNVRWDFDGLPDEINAQHDGDAQQQRTGTGRHGTTSFVVKRSGVLRVVVEGCDDGVFGATCRQGFSFPVTIDVPPAGPAPRFVLNVPASSTSVATPTQPAFPAPLLDNVSDGAPLDPKSADWVVANLCDGSQILDGAGDHDGELSVQTAAALLLKVRKATIPCRGLPDSSFQSDTAKLRAWVNQKIREAKVSSHAGTNAAFLQGLVGSAIGISLAVVLAAILGLVFSPAVGQIALLVGIPTGAVVGFIVCHEAGDYDMRLVGLVQIAYEFDDLLDQSTKDYIRTTLLTESGPADRRKEHLWLCGIPTPIGESENHILMTESSRYLTNQLIAEDAVAHGRAVPGDNNNETNSMNDWFLGHLQEFMQQDFYEYNARPYTYQARLGIQNLADYAAFPGLQCGRSNPDDMSPAPQPCDVRRGARIVLDYLAAKFAVSSNGLRRVAPFRRQPERREFPYLFGRASDEAVWTYLAYANGSSIFWRQRYGLPDPGAGANLLSAYVGRFRPSPVITDIMSDAQPVQPSYERFYFNRDTHYAIEVYYRDPDYTISAGGFHDPGRISFLSSTEDAWAMPTTLMPTLAAGGLDRREFVSILGAAQEDERVNTCVAPDFACGQNPWIPPGVPRACRLVSGDWTFLDFSGSSPGCDINYGYYVIVYSAACAHKTCDDRFGFFEVTRWQSGGSLAALANKVLARNPDPFREDEQDIYVGATDRAYYFVPSPPRDNSPPLKGELWETWGMMGTRDPGAPMLKYDTNVHDWPLADGALVHSDEHKGCVIVDNPRMAQRLVLDYSVKDHPTRTRVWTGAGAECGCPLAPRCLPREYQ